MTLGDHQMNNLGNEWRLNISFSRTAMACSVSFSVHSTSKMIHSLPAPMSQSGSFLSCHPWAAIGCTKLISVLLSVFGECWPTFASGALPLTCSSKLKRSEEHTSELQSLRHLVC